MRTLAVVDDDDISPERPATPALALAIITRAIRTVPGVTDVKDVAGSIDNASRTLTYSATVVTGDGNFGVRVT